MALDSAKRNKHTEPVAGLQPNWRRKIEANKKSLEAAPKGANQTECNTEDKGEFDDDENPGLLAAVRESKPAKVVIRLKEERQVKLICYYQQVFVHLPCRNRRSKLLSAPWWLNPDLAAASPSTASPAFLFPAQLGPQIRENGEIHSDLC